MLRRKLCEATIQWDFQCDGPLLIADGRYDKTAEFGKGAEEYPDKFFLNKLPREEMVRRIRSSRRDAPSTDGWGFYVPGSSIRGPFRALSEKIVRSMVPENPADPTQTACDPFDKDASCSKRLENNPEKKSLYPFACPACKLFGCAGLASRIDFSDAEIGECKSVYRDMIGIDRFTAGVFSGANMRFHALENCRFSTRIRLVNFELWQMGLMAYVFKDFEEGMVSIGFGKTKGFGKVSAKVSGLELSYPRETNRVEHLGSLATEGERTKYDLATYDPPEIELAPVAEGISLYKKYRVADLDAFWSKVAPAFNSHIETLAQADGRQEVQP